MVVKNEGDDRCPHLGHAPVMSLADRFRQIKSRLEVSEREISRRCGLEETHFTKILKRLDSNPNADIEQETLHKIAVGARGMQVFWLSDRVGTALVVGEAL
jgi:AraC-like DNA-binding protein